jgi:hypothetical protein
MYRYTHLLYPPINFNVKKCDCPSVATYSSFDLIDRLYIKLEQCNWAHSSGEGKFCLDGWPQQLEPSPRQLCTHSHPANQHRRNNYLPIPSLSLSLQCGSGFLERLFPCRKLLFRGSYFLGAFWQLQLPELVFKWSFHSVICPRYVSNLRHSSSQTCDIILYS